jgi:hypothetical protein
MNKDSFKFVLEIPVDRVRSRCLSVITTLGWKVRNDLTRDYQITCYVPIADLLPQAPVYTISLYPLDGSTHVALVAANDNLSQSHAITDLVQLKAAILAGDSSATASLTSAAGRFQARCFISYRRYDSADVVGRIYDRLIEAYGTDKVFKDVDNIPLGVDFRRTLDEAITGCAVILVVIGRDWLAVTNENNQRRLDDPTDFVRIEIESALKHDIPIVPLLVRDASMPRDEEMPVSLKKLVYRNGVQIRSDPDFHRDMDRLIHALKNLLR